MKNTNLSLIFVLIFFIMGVVMFTNGKADEDKGTEVTATIDRIDVSTRRVRKDGRTRTKTDHDVYINYEYNGQKFYNVRYNYYESTMNQGDDITIKVDENNPNKIYYAEQNKDMGVWFMVVSGVMGLVIVFGRKKREDY